MLAAGLLYTSASPSCLPVALSQQQKTEHLQAGSHPGQQHGGRGTSLHVREGRWPEGGRKDSVGPSRVLGMENLNAPTLKGAYGNVALSCRAQL